MIHLAGCTSGGPVDQAVPSTRAVTFEYQAPTRVDPRVDFDTCSVGQAVFTTHLHFTWNSWEDRRYMVVAGADRFTYRGQVPTGRDLRVALHDPNTCLLGDVYVAPTNLSANGVPLRRVVNVREGTALAFDHEVDGSINP